VSEAKIRRAVPADAATIAGIHVRGWQWAYRGLMPDAFLDSLSIEERGRSWRELLDPEHAWHTWLAEADGQALGFVTCGPTSDDALPDGTGEVFALYQEAQTAGTGVGRALFSHAMRDLLAQGFNVAVLWVLESNQRARRFYEVAGWNLDGAQKEDRRADHVRHQVRYRSVLR
jgi:GNAT superfamily N-acetyltransferase